MNENDRRHLKELLLRERREIFNHLYGLESDWHALSEHDIEREEEAQKVTLADLLGRIKARDRQRLSEIEGALTKMMSGTYGICEECREPISLARLQALPTTSFCRRCASELETKQKSPTFPL
ncbi:TraR/DksA family transcriptional regulator [Desulforhopalus sp. IMCC35007]|uniref:TraR/DksA family transcriptional regulator n=1 Tax=Desulforhopalus sp. IMCC35007 TaxID=2569543 RepID=UPI0010ADB2BD|nr:TraR/DksA family transcriptional regulator [Desulforhopalus sp. IMCC35007]TKB06369.1 TraR/DksA family transcriptional regulator [Desulforhopalus sp. IMCC35007]